MHRPRAHAFTSYSTPRHEASELPAETPARGIVALLIGDFGQAAVLQRVEAIDDGGEAAPKNEPHTRSLNESPCTWEYAAPEILHKQSYDFKLDIWSSGAILWQMLQARI